MTSILASLQENALSDKPWETLSAFWRIKARGYVFRFLVLAWGQT